MVVVGLSWLVASIALFGALLVMVQAEKKRGKRFLLAGLRGWLDHHLALIGLRITGVWDHFVKYIVQLGWYYGIHSFLKAILATLVAFYERVEHVFENNRRRTKQLRAEKKNGITEPTGHLAEMAQHKADTALTPAQQRKLKATHLRGD